MAQGLERFMIQLEKACDELDSGKADHDTVKERIAAAMAAAQVVRVQLMQEQWKEKTKLLQAS